VGADNGVAGVELPVCGWAIVCSSGAAALSVVIVRLLYLLMVRVFGWLVLYVGV
jgi:hypothetical protein